MNKLCIFVGILLGGWLGWWAAEAIGLEFFGAFLISGAGSLLGVWLGWKIAQRFE